MDNVKKVFKTIGKGLKWFFFSLIWIIPLGILLDQGFKQLFQSILTSTVGQRIEVIPNFFYWTLVYNKGTAFGLLSSLPDMARRIILPGISLVMGGAIVAYFIYKYKGMPKLLKVALCMMIAGAFGNFIDRAFYPDGAVIDFIDICINGWRPFAVFNLADSLLVIGLCLVVLYIIILEVRVYKVNKGKGKYDLPPEEYEKKIEEEKTNENNDKQN